ncbi:MAG TPA: hypothetical protein VMT15_04845 [Bryobacteraceae bacterium]|nr:hypothetical protein [Bryobacteraceae bacterium]
MTLFAKKTLYWVPRGLCVAFGLFVSVFALDVFQEGLGFWRTLAALLIHLIPVFLLFAILAVAWRWEWVGAVAYAAMGLSHLVWAHGRHLDWRGQAFIAGPLFILAGMFLVNWLKRAEIRAAHV